MTFRVLMVCTGNVCRSPMAEVLLRARLGSFEGITTSSAGTDALVGAGMTAQAATIAVRLGAQAAAIAEHQARQLEPSMVRESELVMALTRDHRSAIVKLEPSATLRTFTLREFAHVTDSMRVPDSSSGTDRHERLRDCVAVAASLRGVVPQFERPDDADVIDPYRLPDEAYERTAAQLVPSIDSVARFLRQAAGGPA